MPPSRADLEGGRRVHAHASRVLPMQRVITCDHPWIAVLTRAIDLDVDILRVLMIIGHAPTLYATSDTDLGDCPRYTPPRVSPQP